MYDCYKPALASFCALWPAYGQLYLEHWLLSWTIFHYSSLPVVDHLLPIIAGKNEHRLVLFAGKSKHHLDLVDTRFTPTNF